MTLSAEKIAIRLEGFNRRGIKLIGDYKGSNEYHTFLCTHDDYLWSTKFGKISSGGKCPKCCLQDKKVPIDQIQLQFQNRGYTLLSLDYKNCSTLLPYMCSQNHISKISYRCLMNGRGCKRCFVLSKSKPIQEIKAIFESKNLTLLSTECKSSKTPLNYVCSKGHKGTVTYANLKKNIGCSSCAEYGFNPSKPATLYYIRFQFEGNFYYKIGITNKTILSRFKDEKFSYVILNIKTFTIGIDAYNTEQKLLKSFNNYRYVGHPFLRSGNTELFVKDVLRLDGTFN